jgi:hypothetical protein
MTRNCRPSAIKRKSVPPPTPREWGMAQARLSPPWSDERWAKIAEVLGLKLEQRSARSDLATGASGERAGRD